MLEEIIYTSPNNNYIVSHTFLVEAKTTGINTFSVLIEPVENEKNTKNNRAEIVMNVLENKQKILILSDGVHPDIGVIKNTLDLQTSYEVSVFTEEPFPVNVEDFNLIIFNQVPTAGKSFSTAIEKANELRIPRLYIVGNKTFIPQFNIFTQAAEIIPRAGTAEEAQAAINSSFATFSLSEEILDLLPKFPPLVVPFADYETDPGITALAFQKIRNIETTRPLIAAGIYAGRKTGFIFGEGIWKWRLFNYFQAENHNGFNELINQLVQYLALRENEDNFIVDCNTVYDETDDVTIQAELYNDVFEPVGNQEITITLKNSNGNELDFTFDIRDKYYFLNAGNLPAETYEFNAEVTLGNETYTENGIFTVSAVNYENMNTRANHNMLYQLAALSGGNFYSINETNRLINDLKAGNILQTTTYYQEMVNELLNLRWLFFVFVVLLSVEWFLRKYWGIY